MKKGLSVSILVILICVFLTSCTYKPVYGSYEDAKLYLCINSGGYEEGVLEAIQDGAHLDKIKDGIFSSVNPIDYALIWKTEETAALLIENGADVNCRLSRYCDDTILMMLASNKKLDLCKLALEKGAKIGATNSSGNTALETVFESMTNFSNEPVMDKIITLFLDNGAKITPKTLTAALKGYYNKGDGQCRYKLLKRVVESLIKDGYGTGLDPLLEAAIRGDSTVVNQLISDGQMKAEYQNQVLFYTAAFGNPDTLKLLREKGLDLDLPDEEWNTTLILATNYGNLENVRYLLSIGSDIEAKNRESFTPLILATHNNYPDIVELLMESGAKTNSGFYNILYYPAVFGDVGVMKTIIACGYKTDKYILAETLYAAAMGNQPEAIRFLLDLGAGIDDKKYNALEISCLRGNLDAVKCLIENGAKINGTDYQGRPLSMASEFGSTDVVQYLISKGANVNAVEKHEDGTNYMTALNYAFDYGHFDIVKLLVENGADLELQDSENNTAILFTARDFSKNILEYLIQKGADMNHQNKDGETALMRAAVSNMVDNVEILLAHGADKSLRNSSGQTAFDIAKAKGYSDIAKLLR